MSLQTKASIKITEIPNKKFEEKIKHIEKLQKKNNKSASIKITEISNKKFEEKIKHIEKLQQEVNKLSTTTNNNKNVKNFSI